MMNLTSIYGIYGDEKGINIYKYFDLHTMLATILAQFFVSFFGSSYFSAMVFFSFLNVAAIVLISRIHIPRHNAED